MANQISYPLINGHRYSFASIEARVGDKIFFGFQSINYTNPLGPSDVYGNAPHKIGRTRGKYEPTANFSILRLEYENLKEQLALLNAGQGYQEVAFNFDVAYAEVGQPVILDQIIGARIVSSDFSNSEGPDASLVTCELNVIEIRENNILPVSPLLIASSV